MDGDDIGWMEKLKMEVVEDGWRVYGDGGGWMELVEDG